MNTPGPVHTIPGSSGQATHVDDLAQATPAALLPKRRMICRVNPMKLSEIDEALAEPLVDIVAYNVSPRDLNPAPGVYRADPFGVHLQAHAAKKWACPILIPVRSDGLGLPTFFEATPGAWVTTTDGKKLPRPNDPKYVAYMASLIAGIAPLWNKDAAVGLVRVCGFSVDTNEPSFYNNGKTSGWAALKDQLSQAVAVPIGSPPIAGVKFSGDSPVLDGNDSVSLAHLNIVDLWQAVLAKSKCAVTIKFGGGTEDGFRYALRQQVSIDDSLALNTGMSDNPDHADAFLYAQFAPFGWGGITISEDPSKVTGLSGLERRIDIVDKSIPTTGPKIRAMQAELGFWQRYREAAELAASRLVL